MLNIIRHSVLLTSSILLATTVIAGADGKSVPSDALASYRADDLDVDAGTIKGKKLESLLDVELKITGFVKSSSNTAAVMYLSQDKGAIDTDSYDNCINLIVDSKLKFSSHTLSRYAFTGKLILMDRIDPSVVYLTYKNIRVDASCQYFKKPDKYPYFVVESYKKVRN